MIKRSILLALSLLLAILPAHAKESIDELLARKKTEGQKAYDSGNYTKAFDSWFPEVAFQDSEIQEKVALLLLTKPVHSNQAHVSPKEEFALWELDNAALNGRSGAMTWLAKGSLEGIFGLKINAAAAQCWADAAEKKNTPEKCFGLTEYRNEKIKPTCAYIIFGILNRKQTSESLGVTDAKRCLLMHTYAFMVPGGPPSHEAEMRAATYKRHHIELIITGDSINEEFEAYRKGFNETMDATIMGTLGQNIYERIEAEADANIAEHRKSK